MEVYDLPTLKDGYHSEPPTAGWWKSFTRRFLREKRAVLALFFAGLFGLVALFAPILAPSSPVEYHFSAKYQPPVGVHWNGKIGTSQYLLGTDFHGRDLLSRLMYGARSSMLVGVFSAVLVALLGTGIGATAGYRGGRADHLLMQLTNIFAAFPGILFYITIVLIFRDAPIGRLFNGMAIIILALVVVNWIEAARLIRGTVLVLKEEPYVEAARAIGARDRRILFRHILPNCSNLILVWLTFAIPRLILVEATLGYLGIGFTPIPKADSFFITSWGGILNESRIALNAQPAMMLSVLACLMLVGASFTALGEGLRKVLDPKQQG